jgi:hypothetical protein
MTVKQVQEIKNYADEKIENRNYFNAFTDAQIMELDYTETVSEIDDLARQDAIDEADEAESRR